MRTARRIALTASLLTLASPAVADDLRLHATGGAARALGGHQSDELGWGGAAYGAAEWGFNDIWGLQFEAGWIGLSSGDPPSDPDLAELDGASGVQLGLGLRVRPFGSAPRTAVSAAGLWLSAAGGLSITGGLARPQFDAFLGYDFFLANGAFGVGPAAGYVHVFQGNDEVRPDDARIAVLGLHATFDFAERAPIVPPPPPDTDGDGILDADDMCPDQAEDRDGYQDSDGCPEADNDSDGILDGDDKCPLEAEDKDGFEDDDGCPEADNDRDGVLDGDDKCPLEPEDREGFEDEDGCPDPDNDRDGIADADDLCPLEPETKNNYADEDGCPDEQNVRVVGDKIVLDEKIRFWTDSYVIRAMSYPVLTKLATLLNAHPEYTHVAIEGHADSRGAEEVNLRLSKLRANAVKDFLIQHGVKAERLSSEGFGSSRPIAEGDTERAWFLNRRVEFVVTRERKSVAESAPAPEAESAPLDTAPPGGEAPEKSEDSENPKTPGAHPDEPTDEEAAGSGGGQAPAEGAPEGEEE